MLLKSSTERERNAEGSSLGGGVYVEDPAVGGVSIRSHLRETQQSEAF